MIFNQILKITFLNKPERFLYTVKCFHLILNNSLLHKYSLVYTKLVIGLNTVFSLHTVR